MPPLRIDDLVAEQTQGGGQLSPQPHPIESTSPSFASTCEFAYRQSATVTVTTIFARQPPTKWFGTTRLTVWAAGIRGLPNDHVHAHTCRLAEQEIYDRLRHWTR